MKNTLGNYNTDSGLWENFFRSKSDAKYTIIDGHVYVEGQGCLARFTDSNEARSVIAGAKRAASLSKTEPAQHTAPATLSNPVNAQLLAALKALRHNIDVSTINNSKRSTTRWTELVNMADQAIASAK